MSYKTRMVVLLFVVQIVTLCTRSAIGAETANFCYLPTEQNVAYADVIELPVQRPSKILEYGDNALQFGELWLPKNQHPGASPLVVLIHGGCWLNTYNINHTHALSTALAHVGYAVWSIEYRRTGDDGGGWPGSLRDIEKAISYIMNIKSADFDATNVALVGHSAGGHLALLAGSSLTDTPSIKGVIGLAAITDVTKYARGNNSCQTATSKFFDAMPSDAPNAYKLANPAQKKNHHNTILIHGSKDNIVPIAHSSYLPSASSVTITGAGHFDMIHPGTESFQALLRQLATLF